MSGKTLRAIFLVLVIFFGCVAVFCGWMAYSISNSVIAFFLLPTLVLALVLGLEIFSVIATKKTLSTNVTKAIETYKKIRFWVWGTIISMILVLTFLIPHLVITGP